MVETHHQGGGNVLGPSDSFPALMKILCGIIISRRISMPAISSESIDLCRSSICFDDILLEEELKANEMFAKEVNIVKSVPRFSTSSAGLTCVKVFIGCQRIDTAVEQSFKMIETWWSRDVTWVVIIEGNCANCFGL